MDRLTLSDYKTVAGIEKLLSHIRIANDEKKLYHCKLLT